MRFLLLTIFLLCTNILWSQSDSTLYSQTKRIEFAQYLQQRKLYREAALEWRQICLNWPADSNSLNYLRILRLAGLPDSGLNYLKTLRALSASLKRERLFHLYLTANLPLDSALPVKDSIRALFVNCFLHKNTNAAKSVYQIHRKALDADPEPGISHLIESLKDLKHKNSAVAMVLSVIPGFGKMYQGHVADGVVALAAVAVNGFLSVHLFLEHKEPFWAWSSGLFASGMYIGSIYGTARNIRLDKSRQTNQLYHEAANLAAVLYSAVQ